MTNDKEREAFESWQLTQWPHSCFVHTEEFKGGEYIVENVQRRWEGWKARSECTTPIKTINAAFINEIAENGTKELAVELLRELWAENVELYRRQSILLQAGEYAIKALKKAVNQTRKGV